MTFPQSSIRAGAPVLRTRPIVLFSSAGSRSHPGMEPTGTKADEMNVSGKRIVKPYAFDASGDDAVRPMKAKTHENA